MNVLAIIIVLASVSNAITQRHALFVRQDALSNGKSRVTRQTSADQMVQNILQWLQGVYAQNSRKIRQGSFREYLPPTNTQKPRPFEPNEGGSNNEDNFIGYPPSGFSPNPPFTHSEPQTTRATRPTEKPVGFTTSTPFSGYPTETTPQESFPTTNYPSSEVTTLPTHPTTNFPLTHPTHPPLTHPTHPPLPTHPPTSYPTHPPPGHLISTTEAPYTSEPQAPGELHATNPPPPSPSPTEPPTLKSEDSETSGTNEEEDLKHPPHIHAIDVECAKDMMTINIEFNRRFDGIIYSKGYFAHPECRYVSEQSGQTKYSFTVSLNNCGTEFINAFDTEGQSYLENVLVLQNEPGIQEVWDTIRAVRCLWAGNLNKALSVALSVGMLTQEIVTFSGDTAMAKLDIQLGRGPFAAPANGLVKIGDTMTLVVSVTGDPGFDLQVKDCRAKDASEEHSVALTDEHGCVLKPKLFGAFQKTRSTGNSGASIIAYAFFSAFKFPDVMDLMIECNVELCKTDCEACPNGGQNIEPGRRRRAAGEPVRMGKTLRVILPEDLSDGETLTNLSEEQVCMSMQSFVFSSAILIALLVLSCVYSAVQWRINQRLLRKL